MRVLGLMLAVLLLGGCSVVFSNLNPLTPNLPPPFALNSSVTSAQSGAAGTFTLAELALVNSSNATLSAATKGDSVYLKPAFTYSGPRPPYSLSYKVYVNSSEGAIESGAYGYSSTPNAYSLTSGVGGRFDHGVSHYSSLPKLQISESARPGAAISLTFSLSGYTADSSIVSWSATGSFTVAPAVSLSANLSLEEASGNGDGVPNNGETLYLRPMFTNAGARTASNVQYRVTTSSSHATLEAPNTYSSSYEYSVGEIKAGGISTRPSTSGSPKLKIASTAPDGTVIPLTFSMEYDYTKTETVNATVTVASPSVKLSVAGLGLQEASGNGDHLPNRGEALYLRPTFHNKGTSSTNALTMAVTTSSSYATIEAPSYSAANAIAAIPAGGTSASLSTSYCPKVRLNPSTPAGTAIPLAFALSDTFGNRWMATHSVTVTEIAASLSLASFALVEVQGNGDNLPNRGETLYLQPTFRNAGTSGTNALTPAVTSTSSVATIQVPNYSATNAISAIPAGGTSSTLSTSYAHKLKLSSTATPGTVVPLAFTLTDAYGNQWALPASVTVMELGVSLSLAEMTLSEASGNGDGRPNQGELLYLKPTFRNAGPRATNAMAMGITTSSPHGTIEAPTYSTTNPIGVIAAGGTSTGLSNYYVPKLRIAASTPAGTAIPLVLVLSDSFGNQWHVDAVVTVQ